MPLSGKQRRDQLKRKRAVRRGDQQPEQPPSYARPAAGPRRLQSEFVRPDKRFLDDTKVLAAALVLRRPVRSDAAMLATLPDQLTLPRRPKWRYQMSKDELDANEQAHFRTWLAQQDAIVEQWQRALMADHSADLADVDNSEPRSMPHPPTYFERNIQVWRQFWRVTEISEILLVLLDSRCPTLHLPPSLSAYLGIPTAFSQQNDPSSRSKKSAQSKFPTVILVLTKTDISGPARTASWTSFLSHTHPGVPVVPVEAYAQKPSLAVKQGPARYEPHLPGTFRERLVHTLRDAHQQLLQPPQWVTAPRATESEEQRHQRVGKWRPKVKKVINWDQALSAKGKTVRKAVGGSAVPKGQIVQHGSEDTEDEGDVVATSDGEQEQFGGTHEWKEPKFLTIGLVGQPNVGKSSLLNAIFGVTRVRASRTPGKTKHFQTLFWTTDVRLVDCPGLVMPSFVPMDMQVCVLSGVLPISRIAAVPFCVHQLAQLLPLERILGLAHPSSITLPEPASFASSATKTIASTSDRGRVTGSSLRPAGSPPLVEDKRTWRTGQHPVKQTKLPITAGWTANDILTAYAEKKGWVTAKAGRPDAHRAGNAILRLVVEGKIPWGFWPPDSSVSGDDGIWLRDGVQQHTWDELQTDEDSEQDSEMEELASDREDTSGISVATGESEEVEDKSFFQGGNLGRFGLLSIDD